MESRNNHVGLPVPPLGGIGPSMQGARDKQSDFLKAWQWVVLILFSPLAGVVGWLLWQGRQPKKARNAIVVAVVMLFVSPVLAPSAAAAIKAFVVQPFVIPSAAMKPTIAVNDRVLVNKFVYRFDTPKRGDVVILDDPAGQTPMLIKRVIAVGGETVDVRGGSVYVDGVKLVEPYTYGKPSEPGPYPLPAFVPPGDVWVMGDNRTNSQDSRWIGPQPVSDVHGQAFFIYFPAAHARWL
jgi:signal peptidase I